MKAAPNPPSPFRPLHIALALVALTLLAYFRAGQGGFVNLDDDAYVEYQALVNQGFRSAGVAFAFTGVHSNNWHPLTTLSHMLDCTLFGVKPAPMHWENVLWHTLNSVLVFFAWRALTGRFWRPAFIAAVFALHPLHVESVAWIAERKDVLHAFFWLLGLLAYAAYIRTPSKKNYLLVAVALVLALLSKPMAVTFPCTLLLLDFWLGRWKQRSWLKLLLEKVPFFALVVLHSVATFIAQHDSGAANFGQRFTLGMRLENAFVAYLRYLGKTFWPESLAPLYNHPGYWPATFFIPALLVFAGGSFLAWRYWRTRPWLAFGWLWFLGTLVPVIGLVQVGAQSMADRYMYIPILGIVTIVAWEGAAALALWPRLRKPLIAATAAALVACTVMTIRQVGAWKNSTTLLERSIAAGEDNGGLRYLLAMSLATTGHSEAEVVAQFKRALEIQPDYVNAMTQLAMINIGHGDLDAAQAIVEQTVKLEPKNPSLHANLGALAMRRGKTDEAVRHFEDVIRLDPRSAGAHLELARIYLNQNRLAEALAHYEARARFDRWNAEAQLDYGIMLVNQGRVPEGQAYLERAVWLNPKLDRAQQTLAALRQHLQQPPPAQPPLR